MGKKTRRIYYLLTFVVALVHSLFFAIYGIFLKQNGLNNLEVSLVNVFYMIGSVLFEVPTGIIADRYGRKLSFVLSCFVFSLSMTVYAVTHGFWWFVLAEVIGAIGLTLSSGAFEAWVVDSLIHHEGECDAGKLAGKALYYDRAAVIIGSISGAHLSIIDMSLPWLLAGAGMLVIGVMSIWLMREDYQLKSRDDCTPAHSLKQVFADTVVLGLKNRAVVYIGLISLFTSFAGMGINMYWNIYLSEKGVSLGNISYIFTAIILMIMLGAWIYNRLTKAGVEDKGVLYLLFILFVFGLIGMSSSESNFMFVGWLMMHEVGRGIFLPLSSGYLNARIESKNRATLLSCSAMMGKAGAFLGLLFAGFVSQYVGITAVWFWGGVITILGLPIALHYRKA